MPLVVSFPGAAQTTLAEVGGKAYSLIRLIEAGFRVPPGAVLTTNFFAPWFDEIKASSAWKGLEGATPDEWRTLGAELKALCPTLQLAASQRKSLIDLRSVLDEDALLAVRSSSPEEDLASASFAGGYETRLGVRPADLEDAVRHCFASSLDERVFVYKREHGFDVLAPRIAVIVQRQIDSEVAGVGFSLNPLTNDFDEAMIEANWGLGESVVAGLASPDQLVVDKVERQVVSKTLGSKDTSIWLKPEGSTRQKQNYRSGDFALTDTQVLELTDTLCRVEGLYGKPMDIEWTYADGQPYLLQARPITTYVPLPPEMLTNPGERRVLYADAALSKGLTINAPVSPMGLAWMEDMYLSLIDSLVGRPLRRDLPPAEAVWFFAGGRMYMNLSNMMWVASPKRLSKSTAASDALMAELFASIDETRYRAAVRPSWARLRMLWHVPPMLWGLRGFFWNLLRSVLFPEYAHRAYQQQLAAQQTSLVGGLDASLSLEEFRRRSAVNTARGMFDTTMSVLAAALAAVATVDFVVRPKSAEEAALAENLKRGFTGNVVVEMGIALYRLAKLLSPPDFKDLDHLAKRIENRQMSGEFLSAWDAFLANYGCRGPMEMDLASPHYADDPTLALRQMSFMSRADQGFDPEAVHKRHVEERRSAYETLVSRSGWLRRRFLHRVHRIIDLFAGTRDTPKHQGLFFYYAVRERVLAEGDRLVRGGRLDAPDDVFGLTFDDLESAAADPDLDLRAIRKKRMSFLETLKSQVTAFPPMIDSRGRILRPPPGEETPGELRGMAVSPGVVTGPVKVLRDPHEKPVNEGDVLVAYTTDPGWTPLFVTASAVVLEVGGILQHGAVVAREYGKPCVVGIDRVISKLRDGQQVEVDGTAGVVRLLSCQD